MRADYLPVGRLQQHSPGVVVHGYDIPDDASHAHSRKRRHRLVAQSLEDLLRIGRNARGVQRILHWGRFHGDVVHARDRKLRRLELPLAAVRQDGRHAFGCNLRAEQTSERLVVVRTDRRKKRRGAGAHKEEAPGWIDLIVDYVGHDTPHDDGPSVKRLVTKLFGRCSHGRGNFAAAKPHRAFHERPPPVETVHPDMPLRNNAIARRDIEGICRAHVSIA